MPFRNITDTLSIYRYICQNSWVTCNFLNFIIAQGFKIFKSDTYG